MRLLAIHLYQIEINRSIYKTLVKAETFSLKLEVELSPYIESCLISVSFYLCYAFPRKSFSLPTDYGLNYVPGMREKYPQICLPFVLDFTQRKIKE